MKSIIVKIKDKIEERKIKEQEYQDLLMRMRVRRTREAYFDQVLAQRAERLREQAKEERRIYIQSLIDKKLEESQER